MCCLSTGSQRVGHDRVAEQQQETRSCRIKVGLPPSKDLFLTSPDLLFLSFFLQIRTEGLRCSRHCPGLWVTG